MDIQQKILKCPACGHKVGANWNGKCIYCGSPLPEIPSRDAGDKLALNYEGARSLLKNLTDSHDNEVTVLVKNQLFQYLVVQLNKLKILANDYPQNSISMDVWTAGVALTHVCDAAVEELMGRNLIQEAEKASRLAIGMAVQVVGHYPQDIFPRVYRNGELCELINDPETAIVRYNAIIADFRQMKLDESILGEVDDLSDSDRVILEYVKKSMDRLVTLRPSVDEYLVDARGRIDSRLGK